MELNFIDLTFYITLNIFTFHKRTDKLNHWKRYSFYCSVIGFTEIMYSYFKIFIDRDKDHMLSGLEKQIVHEGLNKKIFKQLPQVKNLNLIFRLKMFFVPITLILV